MEIFVIRTNEVEKTVEFFSKFGLRFVKEKHGDGPIHYAAEAHEAVFEIYPTDKSTGRCKFLDPLI